MKQKQIDKINLWCKYNAFICYVNATRKINIKPLNMEQDFVHDWAMKRIFLMIQ